MPGWRDISLLARNAKTTLIADRQSGEREFDELLKRFPRDGMIHFQWAEAYAAIQEYELAVTHYQKAETYFPKQEYKQQAMTGARRCGKRLGDACADSRRTAESSAVSVPDAADNVPDLHVIPCTCHKVWDDAGAKPYVPAQEAYTGTGMDRWSADSRRNTVRWMILSAKYGLIEPEHPIGKYDVTFKDPRTGPISQETLTAQALYQRRWGDSVPLSCFKRIHVVCGGGESKDYCGRIRVAFAHAVVSCDHDR